MRFLTDRTRTLRYQKCPRARWWEYEYGGQGVAGVRLALPLAVGIAVHEGLGALLAGKPVGTAVKLATEALEGIVASRGIDCEVLEAGGGEQYPEELAYLYREQMALAEAQVRMYAAKQLPRIRERFKVLEVEQEDLGELGKRVLLRPENMQDPEDAQKIFLVSRSAPVLWMSRADALLLNLDTEELEVMSFKTAASWDRRKEAAASHDMQGLSEAWGVEQRLARLYKDIAAGKHEENRSELMEYLRASSWLPRISGIRMEYLLKGDRREDSPGHYVQHSPLIRGYKREMGGLSEAEYAWSSYWTCSESHPMRKSKWYPTGRCEGGRRHKLGDDWQAFSVWEDQEVGGVEGWIEKLASGRVQPDAGDALAQQMVLLPPFSRHEEDIVRWHRQVSAQEARVAEQAQAVRELMAEGRESEAAVLLDEYFPMHTDHCDYPSKCPCQGICFEEQVAADPIASGLYRWREAHHEPERLVQIQGTEEKAA